MNSWETPVPTELLRKDLVVMDIVYKPPLKTRLLIEAELRGGCKTVDGLWMLVYQGIESFRLWTGFKPDEGLMRGGLRLRASASSAVTVVNAFATGVGSAIGIKLWTRAEVKLKGDGIEGEIRVRGGEQVRDFRLVKAVADVFREKTGEDFGIKFRIESEIPIAMGLKSSSAAANALSKAWLMPRA